MPFKKKIAAKILFFIFIKAHFGSCQKTEISFRTYFKYFTKEKSSPNSFSPRISQKGQNFSYELHFQKKIEFRKSKNTFFENRMGGGINVLYRHKLVVLPFFIYTNTSKPLNFLKSNIRIRSDFFVPLIINHKLKYNDNFAILNLGYTIVYNSKKFMPKNNLGFSSNITPYLLGKDVAGEVFRKYYRNSLFISYRLD